MCVPSNCRITVVGELVEGVNDWELRVRGGEEGQGQRHCSADHRLTVVQLGRGRRSVRTDVIATENS